ncbi:sensor domain-containing diguanylate cyclase [Nocardioides rubriscoriae]|uniref:sensor domain-containing diguanylate cyclase n=1 Tax=Nocardioides rubriscoriae TaxID=642762 RepID=UPI001B872C7A|nr:sensor domain-containing diguanylate cyclase [Nocardioides rubriscoriae]
MSGVTVLASAAVLPWGAVALGPSVSFVPAMIGIVTVFDVLSVYLLVGDYRDGGDLRLLAMASAYAWSLVAMSAYALAFPGAVATDPPFALTASMAPYFYLAWHGGFPFLLGLAWAPWPHRWNRRTPAPARLRTAVAVTSGAVGLALVMVLLLLVNARSLPALIVGLDTSRMTTFTAPVVVPVVVVSLLVIALGTRERTGPERWTAVAVLVCLCDLALTYTTHTRFSLGWYAGRTLTILAAGVVVMAMQQAFRTLKTQAQLDARVDVLTGLDNRREACARLPRMVAHARHRGTSLGIVALDLDHFKTINDVHGHETGDLVLRAVGRVLGDCCRFHDLAARMGGEEFLLVLDDADTEGTAAVAERVRRLVAQIRVPGHGGLEVALTASLGTTVASGPDLDDVPSLLDHADRALYAAKAGGRDRVVDVRDVDGADGPDPTSASSVLATPGAAAANR